MDAVAGARPHTALAIAADAVGAAFVDGAKNFAFVQTAVWRQIEHTNVLGLAGVGDEELFLLGRKAKAIRFVEIFNEGDDRAVPGIETINIVALLFLSFLSGSVAFVLQPIVGFG